MVFKKGEGGRKKGATNKFTRVKAAIVEAFEAANGAEALKNTLVKEDGTINLNCLDRIIAVLPKEHKHEGLELTQNNVYLNKLEKAGSDKFEKLEAMKETIDVTREDVKEASES